MSGSEDVCVRYVYRHNPYDIVNVLDFVVFTMTPPASEEDFVNDDCDVDGVATDASSYSSRDVSSIFNQVKWCVDTPWDGAYDRLSVAQKSLLTTGNCQSREYSCRMCVSGIPNESQSLDRLRICCMVGAGANVRHVTMDGRGRATMFCRVRDAQSIQALNGRVLWDPSHLRITANTKADAELLGTFASAITRTHASADGTPVVFMPYFSNSVFY